MSYITQLAWETALFLKKLFTKRLPPPPPMPRGVRADASYPYHGVEVKCGPNCCMAARALEDQRILSHSSPTLPLPGCDNPRACRCRFLKFNDRRQEQRRIFGSAEDARFYAGKERRGSYGRRASDRPATAR